MIWKYVIAWFPMVIIAIANGVVRESCYKPYVGDLLAHQLSTFLLIVLFSLYVWAVGRRWRIESAKQAWRIGGLWLGMTVAFEFGFGHFVAGHPWGRLLHDYNLLAGRVWISVLIWTVVAPYGAYRLLSEDR